MNIKSLTQALIVGWLSMGLAAPAFADDGRNRDRHHQSKLWKHGVKHRFKHSHKLRKRAVENPAAPDFTSIFNWGLRLENINELFLVAGHGAHDADGVIQHPDDPVAQTQFILDGFDVLLADNGFDRDDIIRIEFTLTNEVSEEEFGQILGLFAEYFAPVDVKPAAGTLRIVDALALPGMLVEYEIWLAK